jgi:sulfite reductase (NADPH) hemoprotein beta-component
MYHYDPFDQTLVEQRVAQFRDQTRRFLDGYLSEDDFRILRLQNGLYIQRHSPMLRVAIPYGMLAAYQLRVLAEIARRWDKGYGHFTTRQNIQFNWVRLENVPDILEALATVQMHAIQTSGNCVRNTTTDHLAGVAEDEFVNPLIWCEVIRQWSMLHPEFAFLPRKFKIAVSGAATDRAAVGVHDIGLQAVEQEGEIGFRVWVGGGLGRTPMVGNLIKPFIAWRDLLTYLQATLRVYNRHGRRDNKYKARIKILVKDLTPEEFARQVEAQWQRIKGGPDTVTDEQLQRISRQFTWPQYEKLESWPTFEPRKDDTAPTCPISSNRDFQRWLRTNVHPHKVSGYAAVTVSLKATGAAPGDITAAQMDAVADLADDYSFGELRVSHEQNLVLTDVRRQDLFRLWGKLVEHELATPNVGLLTNIVSCPGIDYCSLANAASIPVARAIQQQFGDLDYLHDIGPIDLNISGCMNACSHHHVGHIGILGVDKNGEEWYQVTLGGRQNGARRHDDGEMHGGGAMLGRVIGPSFARSQIPGVIQALIDAYLTLRESELERFIEVVERVGIAPFKQAVYGEALQPIAQQAKETADV